MFRLAMCLATAKSGQTSPRSTTWWRSMPRWGRLFLPPTRSTGAMRIARVPVSMLTD